ncbi:MAG: restriction endonuclease subunit S [Sphingobacteriia bacterium]|nr:restriction endonuclease subunit S [Sphingobacteriia bacterium]
MELVAEKYKNTEIMIIPDEWVVVEISDVALVLGGGTPSTRINDFWDGDINWFTPTEVGYDKYLFSSRRKITDLGLRNSSAKVLCPGTILLTSRAGIGDLGILKCEAATNQGFQSLIANSKINNEFLYYLMLTKKNVLLQNASGSTFLEISPSKVKSIKIPLPPLPEQTAIATALSDIDALITQTEKLIEKKKAIKQGVMQELLRPKEGWEKMTINDCCDILNNLRKPLNDAERQRMKGDIPYCGANGVVDYINEYLTDFEMILMAEDGGYFDEFKTRSIAYRMSGKCWVNNHAHILKAKSQFNQDFIYYSVVHKNILDYINGGTRAKLNKSELKNIEIHCPNKDVQDSISIVLNEMDELISSIDFKLLKLKHQKQGMMQTLLTGKIRLV